jgi:hypothetical protein
MLDRTCSEDRIERILSMQRPLERQESTMEGLTLLLVAIGLLIAFDLLAARFGADSRDKLGDDHRRPSVG